MTTCMFQCHTEGCLDPVINSMIKLAGCLQVAARRVDGVTVLVLSLPRESRLYRRAAGT